MKMYRQFKTAVAYDPLIWKRTFHFGYHWIRPSGYRWFRLKYGIVKYIPHPGLYLTIKLGRKMHCFTYYASFRYSKAIKFHADKLRISPYDLVGMTEQI